MKINHAQLETALNKPAAPVYIVSGDELFLKNETKSYLRKFAKQHGFTERVRLIPEAGFDWHELYTLLYSKSLLAEKSVIELDFRDMLPNKTASAILEEYATQLNPDHLLLIDISKVDDKIARSAWYKALEKIGVVIAVWPLATRELPQWILHRAKKYKLQIHPQAANLLAEVVEGNLIAAAQMIEKLYLLNTEKIIDAETIQEILEDESRYTIFDFIEHLIAGHTARSLHILENLEKEGVEPTLIIWAIARELRLLTGLQNGLKAGLSLQNLFQKYKIFAKREPALRRFLKHYSATNLQHFFASLQAIDRAIKGGSDHNPWILLQFFCLRLA